jgi:hypothetical protein
MKLSLNYCGIWDGSGLMLSNKLRDHRQNLFVFLCLLGFSIAIRLPFFFHSVIDWDESTFILMGQSILNGHLPYTEMWDLKPPLTFLFFASAIALLGKSIISIRVAGTLCIASTAYCTYIIGKKLWNHGSGVLASTLYIALASVSPSGQAVMSEHIALLPMIGALCLMVSYGLTPRILFFSGVLLAIATFVRLNLAFVNIAVGLFIAVVTLKDSSRSMTYALRCSLAYAAGTCLIILLVYLPYAVTGNSQLWWSSVVLAPLSYANSQLSFLHALREQTNYILDTLNNVKKASFGVSLLLWAGGAAGIVIISFRLRNEPLIRRFQLILLVVALIGTEISILKGGAFYKHYVIQLVPFMALFASSLYFFLPAYGRRLLSGAVVLTFLILMLSFIPAYNKLVSRFVSGQPMTYGPAYDIVAYLNHEDASKASIYMMTDHIVYWLIDGKPLSKMATHPSTIAKEYLLHVMVGQDDSTENELSKIFAVKPQYIVTEKNIRYLRDKKKARDLLQDTLRAQYKLVKEFQGEQIYIRKADP